MIVNVSAGVKRACYIVAPSGDVARAADSRPRRSPFFCKSEVEKFGGRNEHRKHFECPKR
jgi:hypothetical protein